MPLHIPIARVPSGALVVPSCSKADGPFTCLECDGALVLKQGEIKVFHFAHHHLSSGCSGGGESALHLAAKTLIERYCSRLNFKGTCVTGAHNLERQYPGSSARKEYRYDRAKNYSADVAIFQNGVIASIVEVCVSHATTGDSLQSRVACVGADNVWEVSAVEILKHQAELFTTANAIEVRSLLQYELEECTPVCHRRVREAEELVEFERQQEVFRTTRPCSDCGVPGASAVTLRAPDTETGYLCANCGRKCPSCDDCYVSTALAGCCSSCSRMWAKWENRWAFVHQSSLEKRKERSLRILGPVFKRYSIYLSWKRRRSLRVLGPPLKRYAVFLVWRRRLYLCLRARSYYKAAEHLASASRGNDVGYFRALMVQEWSTWIKSLVIKLEFVAAKRLLLNPLELVDGALLVELKALFVTRLHASSILQRLAQKFLPYIRWTLRKRMVADVARMYRQYQTWVQPGAIETTTPNKPKAPLKRGGTTSLKITEFFGQPKRAKLA
jgi:hypothetical protein